MISFMGSGTTHLNQRSQKINYVILLQLLNQLSKAKTLYETKLDEKLLISLRGKYPALLEEPDDAD